MDEKMSDAPPAITTLESMGILLWHLQQQISRMESQQHTDIKALKDTIDTLASKKYVDDSLISLRAEVNRGKPATLFWTAAKFCAAVTVIAAFVGLAIKLAAALDNVANLRPAVVSK